jgi:hypothetical protein
MAYQLAASYQTCYAARSTVSGEFVRTTTSATPAEVDGPPVSTSHRFSAADWALPDSGPDFISKAFRSSIYKLGISVSFILARILVISNDLKTPLFCGT